MGIIRAGLVLLIVGAAHLPAQQPPATAPSDVASAFAGFVGTWEPADPVPAESPRAQFFAERYSAGPRGSMLWFTQGPHRTDPSLDAVPGFIYWHPGAGRYQYTAFNTLGRFYFEGYIADLRPDRYELFYTVHYPAGARGVPEGAGTTSRQFRDTHRIVGTDLMELETFVLMPDGAWRPFAPTGATSRFRRVPIAEPAGGRR